ncbi:Protein kinase domain-containing protein [Mycena kentingensis (nom. inval.)]|nr:Protein kinase domain-containing protein [Mycena kentingensis (nom. inval.)]
MQNPSASLPDLTGTIVGGDLHLLSVLGTGGFGRVYLARDLEDGQEYAVKCLARFEPGTDADKYQRLEIEIHDKVTDIPGVVTLYEAFIEGDFLFIVLEYVPTDLGRIIPSFIGDPARARATMDELCVTVEALHARGVAHRDLKPENILCDENGRNLRIADFGLACEDATSEHLAGTLPYLPPECLRIHANRNARPIPYSTRATDLWALGVILSLLGGYSVLWDTACSLEDPEYAYFSANLLAGKQAYIQRHLPWAMPPFARFLAHCFANDPEHRLSLEEFRRGIAEMEVFAVPVTLPAPEAPEQKVSALPDAPSYTSVFGDSPMVLSADSFGSPPSPPHLELMASLHVTPDVPARRSDALELPCGFGLGLGSGAPTMAPSSIDTDASSPLEPYATRRNPFGPPRISLPPLNTLASAPTTSSTPTPTPSAASPYRRYSIPFLSALASSSAPSAPLPRPRIPSPDSRIAESGRLRPGAAGRVSDESFGYPRSPSSIQVDTCRRPGYGVDLAELEREEDDVDGRDWKRRRVAGPDGERKRRRRGRGEGEEGEGRWCDFGADPGPSDCGSRAAANANANATVPSTSPSVA